MRSKEFYIEKGYADATDYYRKITWEDTGYLSPELSSEDTYPAYIRAEAEESSNDIVSFLDGENAVTFGFMTDLHYATTKNHRIRMKRMLNAYKDICRKTGNYTLLLGGDLTNEGCKEYKSECFRELREQFSGINYYPANGNHDDGSIWDIAYIDNKISENHLTAEERFDLFYDHRENAIFPDGEKVLYYYIDDKQSKVRYIAADSGDMPEGLADGKLNHPGQWTFAMSQKQTEWFINDALSLPGDGWSIVIFLHSMTPPDEISESCSRSKEKWYMNHLDDIADAFKVKGKLKSEYYDGDFKLCVNADFSEYTKADIIGFFAGDFHRDMIDYTKNGIPKIFTGNSVTYRGGNKLPRNDGDKTEMLFDMVTVNKKTRSIHLTRVGSGDDRDVKY